ncbi:MAG: helix-turn-helix transcriptional regulator [Candidatus Aminicenantes bacterium]|nr:helix-turn-helix transcriptional regulator [Candidatus Aminicenantes bacterium]
MEHIKILAAVANLMIGAGIAVYTYNLYKTYAYPFLQPLTYHIIFYNLLILLTLIYKYLDLNLPEKFPLTRSPVFEDIGYLFIYLFVMGITYAMVRVVLQFQGKALSPRLKKWIFTGAIVFLGGIVIKMILPPRSLSHKWLYFIYENVGAILFVIEIVFLVTLLIYAKRSSDRKKAKICKAFAYLYLARYVFLPLIIVFPEQIRFFASMAGLICFNFLPLLWIKLFFLKYAQSMLSLIEGSTSLERLYKKYNISRREQDILRLIMDGKSNKEIEDELYISIHTVKNHIYSLYQKLGVKTRYQLVHFITKFRG